MKTLIRGGRLLTMDDAMPEGVGDILIVDGVIAAIGELGAVADAEVIDAAGRIVMPGLIDSHRHAWQAALRGVAAEWTLGQYLQNVVGGIGPRFSPEDVRIGDLFGAREALDGGVTTLLDFNQVMNSPEHADAALDGLRVSGIRAIYAPSLPRDAVGFDGTERARLDRELVRLLDACPSLVTLALGARSVEIAGAEIAREDVALARRGGIRIASHVGIGARGRQAPSIRSLADESLLGPDMMFIHCSTSSDEELKRLAETGATATVSPRVEMLMGHGHPAIDRLRSAGVATGLSIDVVTGVVGSLFAEMRTALEVENLRRNMLAVDAGGSPAAHDFTSRDVLRMATIDSARALGLDDRVGSLTVGKQADVIVLNVDTPDLWPVTDWAATATQCTPAHVEHVLVAGELRKHNFRLVGVDPAADRSLAEASRDRLLAS